MADETTEELNSWMKDKWYDPVTLVTLNTFFKKKQRQYGR